MEAQQPIVKAGMRLMVCGYRVEIDSIRNSGVACRMSDKVYLFSFSSVEQAIARRENDSGD